MTEQSDPSTTVGEFWAAFKTFLAVTPEGLTAARADQWPDLFTTRLGFEQWRERWLAYLLGLADGPTTAEEYARLRWRIFSGPGRKVDQFHSLPSGVVK